jgi:hypothetical protein
MIILGIKLVLAYFLIAEVASHVLPELPPSVAAEMNQ